MTFLNVIGPDVSFYQDNNLTPQQIDFAKMKAAGAYFVIIRAGQNLWTDEDFLRNWRAAKEAGLPRGAYFFYDDRVSPEAQAVLFWSLVANDPPELGLWLDLERNYRGAYPGWMNWKKCLNKLRSFTPDVGVYTGPSYWITHRPTGAADLAYFKSFPVWIANYDRIVPIIPSPWTSCIFWQYGTPPVGDKYGVESVELDMNVFDGNFDEFQAYFGLSGEPTTPPQEGTRMKGVVKSFTNIRLSYNKNSADMGDLLVGDVIEWTEEWAGTDGLTWIKIIAATRNGAPVKCTDGADAGGRFCWANNVEEIVPPPAPVVTLKHTIEVYDDGSLRIDGQSFE